MRLATYLAEDGVEPELARSLAEHLSAEIEQSVATRDHVETVVTRQVQGLRVEMTQQLQSLRVELSDQLTMQFRAARLAGHCCGRHSARSVAIGVAGAMAAHAGKCWTVAAFLACGQR
jgi:hypothetical protein